jgi:predicted PurR-regulated permease PerM
LWLTYIKGQLLMALIVGAAMWVVWAALGLPGAFWLGALAGLMETVPGGGQVIAVIPAAAIALIKGSTVVALPNWGFALIVAGVYLALQQVGALWGQPRIVGERPICNVVALAAVIVGGLIGNVVGA